MSTVEERSRVQGPELRDEPPSVPGPSTLNPQPCRACGGHGFLGAQLTAYAGQHAKQRNTGRKPDTAQIEHCEACDGHGWFGIDPDAPCPVRPGPEKVAWLQVRYAAGRPLWREDDFDGDEEEN